MTQAARNALGRVDSVLAENAEPLKSTIANLKIFSEGLAKNTGGLDSIVAGLVKMTGGGEPAIAKTIYDLSIPLNFTPPKKPLKEQLVMPTPTAILMLDTQRFLLAPSKEIPGFRERAMGRQHSEDAAGQTHSELRKLRRRPRAASLDG